MKAFGHTIVATSGTIALTPIFAAEKLCKLGEVSSKAVKKAAEFSEKQFSKGVAGCVGADEYVKNLCAEKRTVIDIRTARTLDELAAVTLPEEPSESIIAALEAKAVRFAEAAVKATEAATEADVVKSDAQEEKPAATVPPLAPLNMNPALV